MKCVFVCRATNTIASHARVRAELIKYSVLGAQIPSETRGRTQCRVVSRALRFPLAGGNYVLHCTTTKLLPLYTTYMNAEY